MVSICGYELVLPSWLSFLPGNFGTLLGTLTASALFGSIFYFLLFVMLKYFFRKSEIGIGNVILDSSKSPFVVFIFLLPLELSTSAWGMDDVGKWADEALRFVIVLVITWWITKALKKGVIYQLQEISEQSEVAWDDILVPVIEKIATPIIWTIGIIVGLEFLGMNLTILYVVLGCGVFILAFILRDILFGLFSGLLLLLDSPFQFGDVVQMEDGRIVVIKDIGLRVTQLDNVNDHSDIFVPNNVLANERLVNITRPTSDFAASSTVGDDYDCDTEK